MDHMQQNGPVPPYEALSFASGNPLSAYGQRDNSNTMDLDHTMSPGSQPARATSELSLDDLEAAHALEGLRAGMRVAQSQSKDFCLHSI